MSTALVHLTLQLVRQAQTQVGLVVVGCSFFFFCPMGMLTQRPS